MLRVCFDVDGVLCDDSDPSVPYRDRPPYPHAVEMLKRLRAGGVVIVIQTARYMRQMNGDQVRADCYGRRELEQWLARYDIPYDEVYLGKASSEIYVDDRGCRVDSNRGTIDWRNILVPLLNERGIVLSTS